MKKVKSTNFEALTFLVIIFCIIFCQFSVTYAQTSTMVRVEPSVVSAYLREPFTIAISLSNVHNLYGVEVILRWNPVILRATNVNVRLGIETFPDGILHESTDDPPIFIAKNNLTQNLGEYLLVATAMAPAPSFNGNGNIFIITFEPISLGESELIIESQLFDYPPLDREPRISLPINHATADSIATVETSTIPPSPTPTPTTSPTPTPTVTPTPSPSATPENPKLNLRIEHILIILITMVIIAIAIFIIHRKRKKLDSPNSE